MQRLAAEAQLPWRWHATRCAAERALALAARLPFGERVEVAEVERRRRTRHRLRRTTRQRETRRPCDYRPQTRSRTSEQDAHGTGRVHHWPVQLRLIATLFRIPGERGAASFTSLPKAPLRPSRISIGGGTDQIQSSIVGGRVLGLPGEPHTDKSLPFNELPS